ncbi:restriction endonuclease family protein [Burkholderia cenocepacia]|uniref:Restriction endonuclease family protein n=1 Tax=Burkholderia cenocepacia TaxID=95486 RepID=A0AAN0RY79_9BURK|nr:restriction endonuclease family protein [Burkholderia cenocepacia]
MRGPLCHVPSQRAPIVEPSDLPYYPQLFGAPESVHCPYCGSEVDEFKNVDYWGATFEDYKKFYTPTMRDWIRAGMAPGKFHTRLDGSVLEQRSSLFICPLCGWWVALEQAILPALKWQHWCITLFATAVLKELALSDIDTPLDQVRKYLLRRFEARHSMHPRLFEETVASVFRDFGYDSALTTYSRDGGIDVILRDGNDQEIGVQVKRWKKSIQVEQIRSFLGALTLGGYAKGIFVSTTKFQRGAIAAAVQCTERHIPIELIDADSFFDMLGVAQLKNSPDPSQCGINKNSPPCFELYSLMHLNAL